MVAKRDLEQLNESRFFSKGIWLLISVQILRVYDDLMYRKLSFTRSSIKLYPTNYCQLVSKF